MQSGKELALALLPFGAAFDAVGVRDRHGIQAAAHRLLIFVLVQVKLKTIQGLFRIHPYELNA
jgi:hypothetical protein